MSTRDLWYSDNPKGASATRIHLYPDCGSLTYPFKASERDTWVRDVPKCARCLKRAEKAASPDFCDSCGRKSRVRGKTHDRE